MTNMDERIHKYLDGVLSASDAAAFEAELRSDAELSSQVETLRALNSWLKSTRMRAPSTLFAGVERRLTPVPPPRLVPGRGVGSPLRGAFRRAAPRLGARFLVPTALAATAALALFVGPRLARGPAVAPPAGSGPPPASSPALDTVRYSFQCKAPGAREVCLAGDFNRWKVCDSQLTRVGEDLWSISVDLPRGRYEYMFVIDGRWVTDPAAPLHRDDGFGNRNAVLLL